MALQDTFAVFRPVRIVCEMCGDSGHLEVRDDTIESGRIRVA